MTMRCPAAFMAARSSTVRGRASASMGLQLRQLALPEVSIDQPGMGNDKVGLVDAPVAVPDDVQVDRPRAPPLRSHPPLRPLDGLACLEQGARRQSGLEQYHLVEIR